MSVGAKHSGTIPETEANLSTECFARTSKIVFLDEKDSVLEVFSNE